MARNFDKNPPAAFVTIEKWITGYQGYLNFRHQADGYLRAFFDMSLITWDELKAFKAMIKAHEDYAVKNCTSDADLLEQRYIQWKKGREAFNKAIEEINGK